MTLPQVAVSYLGSIPPSTFDEFARLVSSENLDLRIEARDESGPYAGVEWYLPTAVIVFLAKSYFDPFLKRLGEDHYRMLKSGLNSLWKRLLGPDAPKIVVISTRGKASEEQPYSLTFSVVAQAEGSRRFKLLLQNDLSEAKYEEAVEAFLEFLNAYHRQSLGSEMIRSLEAATFVGGTMLLVFNPETKSLEAVARIPSRSAGDLDVE